MIEQLSAFPDNVLAFVGSGRVTRADYDTVLVPAVEQAFARHDRVRLYYKIGADFAGIDLGALWEDFKVGVEHLARWERVAVVTDVEMDRADDASLQFPDAGRIEIISDVGGGARALMDRLRQLN